MKAKSGECRLSPSHRHMALCDAQGEIKFSDTNRLMAQCVWCLQPIERAHRRSTYWFTKIETETR